MKILVVDDDGFVRELIGFMLEPEGYEVRQCSCVDEAVKALEQDSYDLIITDLIMPQKTGMDFITYLKKNKIAVPVLAITGGVENAATDYVNIGELYADMALAKPVSRDTLLASVAQLIEEGRKRAEG